MLWLLQKEKPLEPVDAKTTGLMQPDDIHGGQFNTKDGYRLGPSMSQETHHCPEATVGKVGHFIWPLFLLTHVLGLVFCPLILTSSTNY